MNYMGKKVSIVTVCYNSENTIKKTIESVLNQSYENIEYIIVDGASTDDTMKIIRKYEPLFGERIKIISEPDNGIYDAMNKGINRSSGKLIGIINSDDYYELNAVQEVVNAMSMERYQILYGFVRMCKGEEECTIERKSHKFLKQQMISHPASFVTKAIYDDFGLFDLQYVSVADYDFMLRMSEQEEITFIPVDAIITNFALGGMSATDIAWLDLLKLRKNYAMISESQYKRELLKNKVYKIYQKVLKK